MSLRQSLDSHKKVKLTIFAVLVMAAAGLYAAEQMLVNDPRIRPNVHIAAIDVGGLMKDEAEQKLRESILAASASPIKIADRDKVWLIQPADIDFSVDLKRSVIDAYSIGREPDIFLRWKERLMPEDQPRFLPVTVDLNRPKLAQILSALAAQTDNQASDASLLVRLKTKTVTLIPAAEGRKLNVVKTLAQAFRLPQNHLSFMIDLVFDKQLPRVSDQHYAGINTILATYSTYFKPWDTDRNANLRLATGRINGTVLKPGEIFSYNKNVGHRTQQEGFRMAPVILNGKLVPDWGGGVCQVSSTLYNAVLLADMDIVDRSNHGRAIGYVPLGFDATVVDGLIDFKFKNNLKRPIMIHALITDDELTFAILGDGKDAPPPIELDYVVHKVIEPVEIKQPDPTLEVGRELVDESPQRGFKVSTYRIRTIKGKQVSQLLATDDYDPVNRIVKVGIKAKEGEGPAGSTSSKSPGVKPSMPSDNPTVKPPPVKPTNKPTVKPLPGAITLNSKSSASLQLSDSVSH